MRLRFTVLAIATILAGTSAAFSEDVQNQVEYYMYHQDEMYQVIRHCAMESAPDETCQPAIQACANLINPRTGYAPVCAGSQAGPP